MSGFLSFLFVLLFTIALTLAIDNRKEKPRLSKAMWILSVVFAVASSIAGYLYYLTPPPPAVIQKIGEAAKPYVTIKEVLLDPLVAGKKPILKMRIESGVGASSINFSDITFKLTPFVPEKYLKYHKAKKPLVGTHQSFDFTAHQSYDARWEGPDELILTQSQIDDLNADKPTLELYIFARGKYQTEAGAGSMDVCFYYDKGFSNRVAICQPGVKVE
jgi:hypothetical protein